MGGVSINNDLTNPGTKDFNILRLASNVATGESVVIGADYYAVNQLNTASGDTCKNGSFNNTTNPLTVDLTLADYPNLSGTLTANTSQVSIGIEVLLVTAVSGTNVTFARGDSGTTPAAHANAVAIKKNSGGSFTDGTHLVGVIADLTPAYFAPALATTINNKGVELVTAEDLIITGVSTVKIQTNTQKHSALSCTETLAGANNVWAATTMYGGSTASAKKFSVQTRVPNATEVTLGAMFFEFDFTPVLVSCFVYVTATPGVLKAWDGAVTIGGPNNTEVMIDNAGGTDWAATDTILLTVTS